MGVRVCVNIGFALSLLFSARQSPSPRTKGKGKAAIILKRRPLPTAKFHTDTY